MNILRLPDFDHRQRAKEISFWMRQLSGSGTQRSQSLPSDVRDARPTASALSQNSHYSDLKSHRPSLNPKRVRSSPHVIFLHNEKLDYVYDGRADSLGFLAAEQIFLKIGDLNGSPGRRCLGTQCLIQLHPTDTFLESDNDTIQVVLCQAQTTVLCRGLKLVSEAAPLTTSCCYCHFFQNQGATLWVSGQAVYSDKKAHH
jgi:hypothetical protein